MNNNTKESVKILEEQLLAAEEKYEQDKPKYWVVLAGFIVIGIILGIELPAIVNKLTSSLYSRENLDNIMLNLLGDFRINEVLTTELLIVAYDYNSQEPRFFSKYFSHQDPGIYDHVVGSATGASSAVPTFFDPKVQINKYGISELQIDGGIICNNPALYAYEMAKNLDDEKRIRVVSLGTGEKTFTEIDDV